MEKQNPKNPPLHNGAKLEKIPLIPCTHTEIFSNILAKGPELPAKIPSSG